MHIGEAKYDKSDDGDALRHGHCVRSGDAFYTVHDSGATILPDANFLYSTSDGLYLSMPSITPPSFLEDICDNVGTNLQLSDGEFYADMQCTGNLFSVELEGGMQRRVNLKSIQLGCFCLGST